MTGVRRFLRTFVVTCALVLTLALGALLWPAVIIFGRRPLRNSTRDRP